MTHPPRRRTSALGFPLALIAALALLLVSETSYQRSTQAIHDMAQSYQLRLDLFRLQRLMVDAETGQRGYLLTGKPSYLEPYAGSAREIGELVERLSRYYEVHRTELPVFERLAKAMTTKLSELELTIKLRRDGRDTAWQGVIDSEIGLEAQRTVRDTVDRLADAEARRIAQHQEQVSESLLIGRLGVGGMTLLSLLAIYFFFRQARLRFEERERQSSVLQAERDSFEAQVRRRTRQLTQLAQHLQTTQEAERSRLARELHDELGALLTSAKLDVARLRSRLPGLMAAGDGHLPPEVNERLNHLNEALNSGIALKRSIIEDLRPSALGHLGLVVSLGILTREFAQRCGVAMHTDFDPVTLGESGELTVYRFVQEALTNIAKYAKAQRVDVSLKSTADGVNVVVQDDGAGFDPDALTPSAHGLVGMRYRVEAEGGRLQLQSQPRRGTRLSAWLPTPVPPAAPTAEAGEAPAPQAGDTVVAG